MAKTVLDKLGFKDGMSGLARSRPDRLAGLLPLPDDVPVPYPNIVLGFVLRAADVKPMLEALLPRYRRGERLWIAYPKMTGSIRTDMNRDRGWEAMEQAGLLAVAQSAIDDDWSALRFRHRDEIAKVTRKSG